MPVVCWGRGLRTRGVATLLLLVARARAPVLFPHPRTLAASWMAAPAPADSRVFATAIPPVSRESAGGECESRGEMST